MYDLSAISLMSAPAANALSEPVMRMQPTSVSASKASTALRSSFLSVALSALSACGRLRRTMPTRPRRSTTMVCVLMAVLGFPSAGMLSRRRARGKRALPDVTEHAVRCAAPLNIQGDALDAGYRRTGAPTARHVEVAPLPVKNRPKTGKPSRRSFPTAAGWSSRPRRRLACQNAPRARALILRSIAPDLGFTRDRALQKAQVG